MRKTTIMADPMPVRFLAGLPDYTHAISGSIAGPIVVNLWSWS